MSKGGIGTIPTEDPTGGGRSVDPHSGDNACMITLGACTSKVGFTLVGPSVCLSICLQQIYFYALLRMNTRFKTLGGFARMCLVDIIH